MLKCFINHFSPLILNDNYFNFCFNRDPQPTPVGHVNPTFSENEPTDNVANNRDADNMEIYDTLKLKDKGVKIKGEFVDIFNIDD